VSKRPPLTLLIMSLVLVLFVALGVGFMVAANSSKFNRWALEKVSQSVPELQISGIDGSLADTLSFDFRFQTDGMLISMDAAQLKIKPACFWNLTLCIKNLHARQLDVFLQSSDTPSADPIELPELSTPLLLTLEALTLDRFRLAMDDTVIIDESAVSLSASWIDHHLTVRDFTATDEFCHWSIDAGIRFTRQYPIKGSLQCDTTLFPFSSLFSNVEGDLNSLSLDLTSQGALSGRLAATIAPIQPSLPLQFQFTLSQPFLLKTVQGMETDSTQIPSLKMKGEGNLDRIELQASTQVISEWVNDPVDVELAASTSMQSMNVTSLLLTTGSSSIASEGALDFADHIQWRGSSQINNLDFAAFQQAVTGHISGTVQHDVLVDGDALRIGANLVGVRGVLNQQPWQAQGKLEWKNNQLSLQQLDIKQTDNTLLVNGHWSPEHSSDINARFDLNNLSYLLPDLTGQIDGNLTMKGTLQAPDVNGTLNGNGLVYDQAKIGLFRSTIKWKTHSQADNRFMVDVSNLGYGEALSANLQLDWSGRLKQHRLRLSAQDRDHNELELTCDGGFSSVNEQLQLENWQGRCQRLDLIAGSYLPDFKWSLSDAFNVKVAQAKNIQVDPFCLYQINQTQRSQLCTTTPIIWKDNQLADMQLQGRQLPLAWAQPWLPDNANLNGTAELKVIARAIVDQLKVEATLDSANSRLRLRQENKADLNIDFSSLRLDALYGDNTLGLNWRLESDITGSTRGQFDLNDERIDGRINFSGFQISPFTRLVLSNDSDQIQAEVNGDINIAGTIQAPAISGSITAKNGLVESLTLPLPIKNIELTANFNQNKARLKGSFNVADKSGQIHGDMSWENETWHSKMNISAETLAFKPQEDVTINLTPDITFEMEPGQLTLSGDIHVPKARIYLRTLPEQAVSASSDAELVGEGIDTNPRLNVSTQFKISLGDDVVFEGFGLKTMLTGKMEVRQKNNGLMRASGGIRLEKGEYQAYGQQLTISDGDLIFIDDIANPQLRLSAVRDKIEDNVVVGIRVTGRAQNPEITVYSIPDMPQQEKLHYLVTGRAPNADTDGSSSVAAEAALSLALQKNSGFTKKAGEAVGIENLQLTAGSTENRSEVGLSGYITPDLMVRYGVGMFEAVNTISLSYRIRRNLYFEVISGKSNAFDLLWSFDRE